MNNYELYFCLKLIIQCRILGSVHFMLKIKTNLPIIIDYQFSSSGNDVTCESFDEESALHKDSLS